MNRSVLVLFFSLLLLLHLTSASWAKDLVKSGASPRKNITKKSASFKSQAKSVKGFSTALRSQQRYRAKTSTKSIKNSVKRRASSSRRKSTRITKKARRVHIIPSAGDLAGLNKTNDPLDLRSNVAFVIDPKNAEVLFEKNSDAVLPIASITKLMTALVVLDARQDMDEILTVTNEDIDTIKGTSSRLRIGSRLTRAHMLHIALMSSENRAASALGRHYPGGLKAFVSAMNKKAKELGMHDTSYVEPTGLSSRNVSSAQDLAKLVIAAQKYPVIRDYSTNQEFAVKPGGRTLQYRNSNRLISNPNWEIEVQKTGYISEAGRCLVMQAVIEGRAVVMVFLDAKGKLSRASDAIRVRKWLETADATGM